MKDCPKCKGVGETESTAFDEERACCDVCQGRGELDDEEFMKYTAWAKDQPKRRRYF